MPSELRAARMTKMVDKSKKETPETWVSSVTERLLSSHTNKEYSQTVHHCIALISKVISTTPPASMVCWSQKRPRAARRAPKMMPTRVAAMENITWKKMH